MTGIDPPADADLVARVRRGDAAAFDQLTRRYYRAAYATALAACGRPMDAEDVCQDAFLRVLAKIDECRRPERFAGWLLTIVRNLARNRRDYERLRAGPEPDEVLAAGASDPARDAARGELRDLLIAALDTLSTTQREVILLHDMDGWRHAAIAVTLGISEVASRQHLFVARRRLRERLGERTLKEHMHG
jgi:RNA polymerase sigma-70 factor, ECF subfamily